jgi:hypothetical protein
MSAKSETACSMRTNVHRSLDTLPRQPEAPPEPPHTFNSADMFDLDTDTGLLEMLVRLRSNDMCAFLEQQARAGNNTKLCQTAGQCLIS